MKLTLLGTGTPIPEPARRGPATLLETGDDFILIDAGSGVVHRLLEAGHQRPRPSHILLTHLHSDHVAGIIDLLWTGWIMQWWAEPPAVYGPPGTAEFLRRLEHAFEYDISVRNRADRQHSPWQPPAVVEVGDGVAFAGAGCRVTPFRVDHSPVDQAFGYRVDAPGGAVAFSGDTRPVANLVQHAQGVDVLVHEVYSAAAAVARRARLLAAAPAERAVQALDSIFHYHTSSAELGQVATQAGAPRLVLNHILLWGATAAAVEADIAADYRGKITTGEDLMTIDLPGVRH